MIEGGRLRIQSFKFRRDVVLFFFFSLFASCFVWFYVFGLCVGHVVEKSSRKSLFDGNRFSTSPISSL